MDIELAIDEILLEAAMGNEEKRKEVRERSINIAKHLIDDEKLDQYQEREKLLKCSILAMDRLLKTLEKHQYMDPSHLSTIAHFPYLRHGIYVEMISLIKLSTSVKKKDAYLKMLKKLEQISLNE